MCKKDPDLKDSHLMPKSLYGALRNAYPESGKDLVFAKKSTRSAIFTDRQVKRPFLCASCEERLNKYGENIVARECHRGEGKFILLNKIQSVDASFVHNGERWVNSAHQQDLYSSEYLYFAASIIWRASAGDWGDDLNLYHGSLGEKYQEQIRCYLLGESGFPKNVYLAVYIDSDDDILPLMSFPVVSKKIGYHHHIFYIPGIKFSFVIGGKADEVQKLYAESKTNIFFVEYSFRNHDDYKLFHRETKCGVTPKGRLTKGLSNV